MKTIPEIAEDLRTHINNDNDAKRLIVEHILPLLGMDFDKPEHAYNAVSYTEYLEDQIRLTRKDITDAVDTLAEHQDGLKHLAGKLSETARRISKP